MFRAVLWKEWRQLALVRWGGVALGALLPVAFTTGAELAKRGLLPTGEVKAYSPRDLMFEVLPAALALGLWPLIALMSAAQAFAADRAAGTESFLLERPVPRGTVWRARVAASVGTLLVVIVATAAIGAMAAALAGVPPGIGWTRWGLLLGGGVPVALLAWLGGLVAATLLTSPLGAVLAGAVLAGLPVLLAAQLVTVFAHAQYRGVPLGAVLPVLMLLAYIVASWSASCRGEPAGRGRVKRGVAIAAGSIVAALGLFVAGAPIVLRANAAAGMHRVLPSPSGRAAFVIGSDGFSEGGWIVAVPSGRKLMFVPPPVRRASWSPDGSRLAIVTWSGALGSERRRARIDIMKPDQELLETSIAAPDERMAGDLAWGVGGIVAVSTVDGDNVVDVVNPVSGVWRATGFHTKDWADIYVPARDGQVFLRVPDYGVDADGKRIIRSFRLRAVDTVAVRVGEPLVDATGQTVGFAGSFTGVSPSGRFARINGRGDTYDHPRLADLTTGADVPHRGRWPWHWVTGDRLLWRETLDRRTRAFIEVPGGSPTVLREWTDAQVGVDTNLERTAIFVSALPTAPAASADPTWAQPDPGLFSGGASAGRVPEEAVYLVDDDRWIDLPVFSGRLNDQRYTQWAGPKTLARIAPGVVYFEDIDKPGERRFVIGGERGLR